MPDNTLSTLARIMIKVRRLTRSPSTAQISDDELKNYINTFILYDFPENLRLFDLRGTFTFYTNPNQDVYETVTPPGGTNNALSNFINKIISIHEPVYCNGFPILYTQSETQFFTLYPKIEQQKLLGIGDGATVLYNAIYTDTIPYLKNSIVIGTVDATGEPLQLIDQPSVPGFPNVGYLVAPNGPVQPLGTYGLVNYITGQVNVDFTGFGLVPGNGQNIYFNAVPYVADRPNSILFYDSKFTLRPVPDKTYPVVLEAYYRPDELLVNNQQPKLSQWWQYIAYGAAKKIFEDRMDLDSVQMILPEYMNQENLVLRRTLLEFTNERTATVYTEQTADGVYGNGYGWNNS